MTVDEALKASPEEIAAQMNGADATPKEMSVEDTLKATPEEIAAQMNNDSFQSSILPRRTQITQGFGTYNPIEPTQGNVAGDTNFAANQGDSVAAPPGEWTITKAYNQASPQGAPGDYQDNSGWGNDVWLQDKNGHTLHFLHLADVHVQPGQRVKGGSVLGSTGSSGNATGPNLGVEYYDQHGNIGDFLQSPYAKYIETE